MKHQNKRRWAGTTALAGMLVMQLSACAGGPKTPIATTPLPQVSSIRHLSAGDRVRINVFGEPALSGEFQLSGTGMLSLPLVGEVKASGLTTDELGATLVRRYGDGLLNNPRIVVDALELRPFSMLGEVARPGQYPSRDGLTLLEAVALAGGYTYRANKNHIYIRRAGEQVEHEISDGQNPVIAPGDIIRVGERYF